MKKSLLFIPDISGFTAFVQNTEATHSQHVIAELLEILIESNDMGLQLAEVEGDALFFFKEEEIPSLSQVMAQAERMFTAFYSHLRLLETNRICPCAACAAAPKLELKIVMHSAELQFITVQGNRKPFGAQVIEVHRLLKNSIDADNYVLISDDLAADLELTGAYQSDLFDFQGGKDHYDGQDIRYRYTLVDPGQLKLTAYAGAKPVELDRKPDVKLQVEFPVAAEVLMEYITNYRYRHYWIEGVDEFVYNHEEVTRIGSEHLCVINGKHFDFVAVTKKGKPGQLVYGELSVSPPPVDALYNFYILTPISDNRCLLEAELYLVARSPIKKLLIALVVKRALKKSGAAGLDKLLEFVQSREALRAGA